MEDKIEKIFGYFGSIKNEPFYTSCISQIIEIYEGNPQSLKFILYNLNQLIFSASKEVRLRLKHRLIAASLVAKLNKIYVQRVKLFITEGGNFQLENFQLEASTAKPDTHPTPSNWEQHDLLELIERENLLYVSQKGRGEGASKENKADQQRVFDSFLDMNHATMLNIENAFKDVQTHNEVTDEAFRREQMKFRNKMEKINKRGQEEMDGVELTISNPFNLMFEICMGNMLNTEWELRHLSVLVLRELMAHSEFLGFSHSFVMRRNIEPSARFEFLASTTKEILTIHLKNEEKKRHLFDQIITKCLHLLCLDRFADYQTDESIIIVRMVGADILSTCFKALESKRQAQLVKMVKRVFDNPCKFGKEVGKFTWEVKHSFLYWLKVVVEDDKSYGKLLCGKLEESFIKMLANDQVDDITLCICKIIQSFIGSPFFTGEKIDRTNRQVWAIVDTLDDISISARDTLRLLLQLFPYFKLNQGTCIDRLRKFFTSKISEVRLELYRLLAQLYARKKDIPEHKIVESNMVQLMQAAIIEYEPQNIKAVGEVMPHIMPYILKAHNVRKIVEVVNSSVTPSQYTEEIITSRFLMGEKDKFEYTSNEYLYIYEHENVHSPLSAYTDKREWKCAKCLAQLFRDSSEGLEELLRGIEKNNERNHRAKILIFLLVIELFPVHKKLKLFEESKEQASKLVLSEFADFTDNQILKIYMPQFQKTLDSIIKNEQYNKQPENTQVIESMKWLDGVCRKGDPGMKWGHDAAKKLDGFYHQQLNPVLLGQIEILLRLLNKTMKIQRTLNKDIKILAVEYLVLFNHPKEAGPLNKVLGSITEAIKDDDYCFISDSVARAAKGMSLALYAKPKVYNKFNHNICFAVGSSYVPSQLKLQEKPGSLQLESTYMNGMRQYIAMMGAEHPSYLKDAWKKYLVEFDEVIIKEDKQEDKKQARNKEELRLATLLSGTATALLSIDNKPIDGNQFFVHKLQDKLLEYIQKHNKKIDEIPESIMFKTRHILSQSFVYLTQNYNEVSNIFFEWWLQRMAAEDIVFFEILESISSKHMTEVASVASLFILEIIRSITKSHLHDVAMNSLSNLIVGVYTSIKKNPFSPKLLKTSEEGIEFIKNFKNTSNFEYKVEVKISNDITLRDYQAQGITWLGFLTRYNLSGALCDDMGLGKTLQTLVVMENEYKISGKATKQDYLHSLIVCPTTLVQHWNHEYSQYFIGPLCETCMVSNSSKLPMIPKKVKSKQPVIFITSYSVIERNPTAFQDIKFKFIVLDEGHLIKNTRTNKFKAVKKLQGLHRFILTGTPIQNRLIELWGLFDFLMPGYLYAEDVFKKNYEKLFEVNLTTFKEDELLFSEEQRKTLEKLHFKVMPFIMRRMKGDVLRELPQKIINDYYCSMSEIQAHQHRKLEQRVKGEDKKETNVLSNLHEMIKIVNHPHLAGISNQCNWEDSGKFIALGELFEQLGFTESDSILQNKVIIFAKEKATIDLIERYVKEEHVGINYRKLTADVREGDRFTVAQTFNGDSDIKALLVTKSVGGVGLNLSSANTVIMFDHDYNPTTDMQAIDRAHRIGQKRILNVYRLITKDTLEERIMGIQKFKKNLANAIVNIDNASIQNVKESKLPDLLENVRDLQAKSKEVETKVGRAMYSAIVAEMEASAIDTEQFNKKY